MKAFVVNSKELFDKKKNPKLSLSPRDILKNSKVRKSFFNNNNKKGHKNYYCHTDYRLPKTDKERKKFFDNLLKNNK